MAAEPAAVTGLLDRCAGLPLALGIIAARAATHPDIPPAGQLHAHRDPITLPAAGPGVVPERPATPDQALAWFTTEHPVLLAAIDRAAEPGFDPAHLATGMDAHDIPGPARPLERPGRHPTRRAGRLVRATRSWRTTPAPARTPARPSGRTTSSATSPVRHTHLNIAWLLDRQGRHQE